MVIIAIKYNKIKYDNGNNKITYNGEKEITILEIITIFHQEREREKKRKLKE